MPLVYDERIYQKLRNGDIDHLLSQHIAHLFIRDSVSLFSEKVHQNDEEDTDHFENIQSTNWQTMRFKPPPPNSKIGWRVEFRPCEAQLTDFENAAIVCFVVLLTRVILSYHLNFLIPISKVDENMKNAQKRDALRGQRFWFRKNISGKGQATNNNDNQSNENGVTIDDEYELMTINQIINGNGSTFPGLIPLITSYLSSMDVDTDTHCTIQRYLRLIQRRAAGDLLTTASWIRQEVVNHPEYKLVFYLCIFFSSFHFFIAKRIFLSMPILYSILLKSLIFFSEKIQLSLTVLTTICYKKQRKFRKELVHVKNCLDDALNQKQKIAFLQPFKSIYQANVLKNL